MTLEQFQIEAPKTLNELEPRLQLAHMGMGMQGEMLSEVVIAETGNDSYNLLEELTDTKWFIVVLATIKGIQLSSEKLDYYVIKEPQVDTLLTLSEIQEAQVLVGILADVLKREACYGKAKYQKQEVTPEIWERLIYNALRGIDDVLESWKLDPEVGYDRVINKLHGVRYKNPDGSVGFTQDAALNRDHEAEKGAIEGK